MFSCQEREMGSPSWAGEDREFPQNKESFGSCLGIILEVPTLKQTNHSWLQLLPLTWEMSEGEAPQSIRRNSERVTVRLPFVWDGLCFLQHPGFTWRRPIQIIIIQCQEGVYQLTLLGHLSYFLQRRSNGQIPLKPCSVRVQSFPKFCNLNCLQWLKDTPRESPWGLKEKLPCSKRRVKKVHYQRKPPLTPGWRPTRRICQKFLVSK